MVKVSKLLEVFQQMYREHWSYVWGSAAHGCVDCSGAFVYAMKLYGISFPHGSNAIARNRIRGNMLPLSAAKPGMIAFKVRNSNDSGYDLPEKYKQGGSSYTGDLADYYHVGLVDADTKYVLNAKGTSYGFCRDSLTAKNGWDFVALLKDVEYGTDSGDTGKGDSDMEYIHATVCLPMGASGNTVNMRESASKSAKVVMQVPVGTKVLVNQDLGQWCQVTYNGKTGYMMSDYLEYGQSGESQTISDDDAAKIDKALSTITKLLAEVSEQAEIIGTIVGRG